MVLVDTSAWIGHLAERDTQLIEYLLGQRVRTSDVVIGELLLGSGLPKAFDRHLRELPRLPSPTAEVVLAFIERQRKAFVAAGIGWADAQLIVTATRTGARIYTRDRAMRRVCAAVGVKLG